jgi:hypothetical protein
MTSQNKQKILHFSHALYNKASYSELNMHDTGSLQADHKLILGDDHFHTLCSYYKAGIEEQRSQLTKDEKSIVEAHVHAIVKLDSHKAVLAYALPSLDGILFGMLSN